MPPTPEIPASAVAEGGIGLSLRGQLPSAVQQGWLEDLARRVETIAWQPTPRVERISRDGLAITLHPAAEAVSVEMANDAEIRLVAKTASAGPGYHAAVADLAHRLSRDATIHFSPTEPFGDPGNFFREGDRKALERVFIGWLRVAAQRVLTLTAQGADGIALGLPESHRFTHAGLVATPLGPRDERWLRHVVDTPESGIDIFAGWGPYGSAEYLLGLALSTMWLETRWRPPVDDEERKLGREVATWLEQAHAIEPTLAYPWREWSEMLTMSGEDSLRATRASLRAGATQDAAPPIGYRRQMVRVRVSGGWSIEIPGEMAERWEERGTWVATDGRRTLWFNSIRAQRAQGQKEPTTADTLEHLPTLEGDEVLELDGGTLQGVAAISRPSGPESPYYRMSAHTACGGEAAIGTLLYSEEKDRTWALETWASLRLSS